MFSRTLRPQTLSLSLLAAALLSACGGGTETASTSGAPRLLATTTAVGASTNSRTFFGLRKNFTITATATGWTVKDNASGQVTDVSATTGVLRFDDVTINLKMNEIASMVSAAELKSLIELYIAFFNRVPDSDGLAYWITQYKGGTTFEQIGATFYSVATSADYSALTGYSANMSNTDFIKIIYKNVLGRTTVDQGGLDYWNGKLSNGTATRGSLVKDILAAAHGYKGDATYGSVADLLDNKATVGNKLAVQMGLTFVDATTSYQQGQAIAAAVTATGTQVADALIAAVASEVSTSGGGTNDSGSGVGNFADCFNADLYKTGTTYSQTARSKSTGSAATEATLNYTVVGPTTFKGYNATEVRIDATGTDLQGATVITRTYSSLSNSTIFSYGGSTAMTVPGYGSFLTTIWSVPAEQIPLNLAPNAPYSQTIVNKQETTMPAQPQQADQTETIVTTFLGVENVTVAAGSFAACKVKTVSTINSVASTNYSWIISSGTYRGMVAKADDGAGNGMELVRMTLNGK